jgi:hypothetical protein
MRGSVALAGFALAGLLGACAGLEGLTKYEECAAGCGAADSSAPDHAIIGQGDSSANGTDGSVTDNAADAAGDELTPVTGDAAEDVSGDDVGPVEDAGTCAGPSVNAGTGIFVTTGGTDGASCGTSPGSPCKTIGAGITSAHANGRTTVYVSAGKYVEEVKPVAGVTVQGGWHASGATWSFDCSDAPDSVVKVQAPASSNTTVLANAINGAATFSTMTVLSMATSSVQPGQSIYGVFATGSNTQLTLTDVVVNVVAGGGGQTGGMGSTGSSPPSSCSSGDGQSNTTAGAQGGGASAGTFSSSGFTPSSGNTGSSGNAGDNGTGAPSPTPTSYSTCSTEILSCNMNAASSCTGTAGKNGCSGGGGGGGAGGGGGGSSVALFIDAAQVTVAAGSLTAGNGGNGGAGGSGGQGAGGSAGAAGSSTQCTPSSCNFLQCNQGSKVTGAAGGAGGTGGHGSTGGQGGGGAGGDSYAVMSGGGGTVTLTTTTLVAGSAGSSPGGGAAAGVAAMQGSF